MMKIDNKIMKKLCSHKFCILAIKKYCNHTTITKLCKKIYINYKIILKARANSWRKSLKIMIVNINIYKFGKKKNNINE